MILVNVYGGVYDSDGTQWNNGTFSLDLIPGPYQSDITKYQVGGLPIDMSVARQSGSLGSSAYINLNIYANADITPVGSMYRLTICPLASASCGSFVFAVVPDPASDPQFPYLSIDSLITASIPAPRFPAGPGAFGYTDIEVVPSKNPGSTYFNVNTQSTRLFNTNTNQWTNSGLPEIKSLGVFTPSSGLISIPAAMGSVYKISGYLSVSSPAAGSQLLLDTSPTVSGNNSVWTYIQAGVIKNSGGLAANPLPLIDGYSASATGRNMSIDLTGVVTGGFFNYTYNLIERGSGAIATVFNNFISGGGGLFGASQSNQNFVFRTSVGSLNANSFLRVYAM